MFTPKKSQTILRLHRSDKFRQIQTNSDKFRQIQTNSDKFRQIQTNSDKFRQIQTNKLKVLKLEHAAWPHVTLNRFATFLKHSTEFDTDYLVFCNANLLCVAEISAEEFLPTGEHTLLAAQAMGFIDRSPLEFTYERNPESRAYIPLGKGEKYVQGGLQGGKTANFLAACREMDAAIQADLARGIIAVWHDESHWNKYVLNRHDVKILSPAYLFPEYHQSELSPKIMVLDKNNYGGHAFMRSDCRSLSAWQRQHLWKRQHLWVFLKFKIIQLSHLYHKLAKHLKPTR